MLSSNDLHSLSSMTEYVCHILLLYILFSSTRRHPGLIDASTGQLCLLPPLAAGCGEDSRGTVSAGPALKFSQYLGCELRKVYEAREG